MTEIPKRLAGFEKWGNTQEPFEDYVGPFYMKPDMAGGKHLSAFICESHHMNGGGYLHGGMLMSFVDYALFVIARDAMEEQYGVTVSCQTDFLKGVAPLDEIVFADGEVSRNTRSLVFVRGRIFIEKENTQEVLATFSAVLKKMPKN